MSLNRGILNGQTQKFRDNHVAISRVASLQLNTAERYVMWYKLLKIQRWLKDDCGKSDAKNFLQLQLFCQSKKPGRIPLWAQGGVFKILVLSNHLSDQYSQWQRKTTNLHIWDIWIRKQMRILLEKWLKQCLYKIADEFCDQLVD